MHISDIVHDTYAQQFYLLADGHKAFVDYRLEDDRYQLVHSEVPVALRGQGIGKILVEKTFAAIADEGRTGVAHCSYVRHILESTDKWRDVIS